MANAREDGVMCEARMLRPVPVNLLKYTQPTVTTCFHDGRRLEKLAGTKYPSSRGGGKEKVKRAKALLLLCVKTREQVLFPMQAHSCGTLAPMTWSGS